MHHKNIIITVFVSVVLLCSCAKDKENPKAYFAENQIDSLTVNLITYVYSLAPGATDSTKWEPKFRPFYEKQLQSFRLEKYTKTENGWSYYLLIRPVGGSHFRRGVVGRFKLAKGSLKPSAFEETVNTPHLTEELVKERGGFLFREFVKNGNLDKYLPMKQYIEWPDANLKYNKQSYRWESTQHTKI